MGDMTHEQKLKASVRDNPSQATLVRLLEFDRTEALARLVMIKDPADFRFCQGEIKVLDRYIELLSKVVS